MDRIEKIRQDLKNYDLVLVGWSGGKDSTTCTELVCKALPEKQIVAFHVNFGGAELPELRQFLVSQAEFLQGKYKNLKVLDVQAEETFWTGILGKGYGFPRDRFRWCQRFKIDTAKKLKAELTRGKKVIEVVGIRQEESQHRAKHKEFFYMDGKYAPILDWTAEEVWEFLLSEGHTALAKFYKDYYGNGECPYALGLEDVPAKQLSVCGGRSGCWTCTVISEKKLKKELESKGLGELFEWLKEFKESAQAPQNRLPFSHGGKSFSKWMGMLSLHLRAKKLLELLILGKKLGMELITIQELEKIKAYWDDQEKRFGTKMHEVCKKKKPGKPKA
jgi:DNA sulfur modification protein DndC